MITAVIKEPIYDYNGRKYIVVNIDERDKKQFASKDKNVDNPSLVGNDLRIKIPFRYNRPICNVIGLTPVRGLKKGNKVNVDIEYTGAWDVQGKTGTTWKLISIEDVSPPG